MPKIKIGEKSSTNFFFSIEQLHMQRQDNVFLATLFFGRNIRNNIPEYILEQSQEAELDGKTENQLQNNEQDNESIYELTNENEGNITKSTSSETSNSQENNQDNEIEVTDNRTPIFIPDEAPIPIQRTGPVKNLQTKRRCKKRRVEETGLNIILPYYFAIGRYCYICHALLIS